MQAEEGVGTTSEQFEFVMAIENVQEGRSSCLYPTWTEVLEVINQLGYRKVLHRDLDLPNIPEPELLTISAAIKRAGEDSLELFFASF